MKKMLMSLVLGFSLITLMGSAFAQSTNLQSQEEIATKRNGEYYKLVAPIDYSKVVRSKSKLAPVDYSKVITHERNLTSLNFWEETAAKRNGEYYKIVAQ